MDRSHPIPDQIEKRREWVFMVLAGLFLGTLGMLNVLGVTRFIDLSFNIGSLKFPMIIAVGVLPYPITFLCTDLISELYGKKRATQLVWAGLIVNIWVVLILWLGGILPGFEKTDPMTGQILTDTAGRMPLYFEIQKLALGAVLASMVAYLLAQMVDVHLFHFWKNLTKGKHLWLRNNGSTIFSQLIDTCTVILITHYYAHGLPINEDQAIAPQLMVFILSGYGFKLIVALLDTVPFYLGVRILSRYLRISKV